jgi:RHS repeat-associated protein
MRKLHPAVVAFALLAASCSDTIELSTTSDALATRRPVRTPPLLPAPLPGPKPSVPATPTDPLPSRSSVSGTGDFVHLIPLEVPPGRAGLQPDLELLYTTSGPNSLTGVGFSFDAASEIRRCRKTFATDGRADGIDFDTTDVYCLDGARMVALGAWDGAPGSIQYRTFEDKIARIVGFGPEGAHTSFVVWLKNGRVRTYDTKVEAHRALADGTFVSDLGVFTTGWLLTREEDRSGNTMLYSWSQAVESSWPFGVEVLLEKIEYTGRNGEAPKRSVKLSYENRPDAFAHFEAGTRREINKRLATIEMWAPNPNVTAKVWQYDLTYDLSPGTERSRLASIQRCGSKGGCSLLRTFSWQTRSGLPLVTSTHEHDYAVKNWVVFDANGDGRDDVVVEQDPNTPGSNPHGEIRFGNSSDSADALSELTYVYAKIPGYAGGNFYVGSARPIDSDNSGRNKLHAIARISHCMGYLYTWNPATMDFDHEFKHGCSNNSPPDNEYVDVDGDGRLDYFQSWDPNWNLTMWGAQPSDTGLPTSDCGSYFGADLDGDGRGEMLSSTNNCNDGAAIGLDDNGSVVLNPTIDPHKSGTTVTLADLNGDALPEALYLDDPPTMHWNTGNGFGPEIPMEQWLTQKLAGLPSDARKMIAADMDGDGRQDLVLARQAGAMDVWVMLSRGDGTFEHLDTGLSAGTGIRVGDFDGDGRLDLAIAGGQYGSELTVARQAGDSEHEVDVLHEIEDQPDGFHPRAVIGYARSPQNSAPNAVCTYPSACLRYGIRAVRWVWGTDFLATRWFHFSDPRVDLNGGGFLGFGTVREWVPERPVEITTTYDHSTRDRSVFARAHRPAKIVTVTPVLTSGPGGPVQQLSNINARIHEETTNYEVRWNNGRQTYFVRPSHIVTREWEELVDIDWQQGAVDPITNVTGGAVLRTRTRDRLWDDFANELSNASITPGGDKSVVTRTFDNLTASWLVGLMRSEQSSSGRASLPYPAYRVRELDYDNRGRLTETRLEPNNPDLSVRQTTALTIDTDGNVRSMTSNAPGSAPRTLNHEYQDFSGERVFPSMTWNELGHGTSFTMHSAYGVEASRIDPNGVTTESTIDDLGRTVWKQRAGDAAVTTTYAIAFAGPVNTGTLVTESWTTGAERQIEKDDRGLIVEDKKRAFDGSWNVIVREHDAFDRVVSENKRGNPGALVLTTWNSLDQKLTVEQPNGGAETFAYPSFGVTIVTDAEGRARRFDNDLEDRTVKSTSWGATGAIETEYTFGNFGLPDTITDELGNVVIMDYDARGRRTLLDDPSLGLTTTVYNGHGEIISTTNAENEVTTYGRDALGRATTVTTPEGVATFTWDTSPHGIGALASSSNPTGDVTIEKTYDTLARLSKTRTTIGADSFDVDQTYNALGQLAMLSYPFAPGQATRFEVAHDYGDNGTLSSLEVGGALLWQADARNADDLVTAASFGNNLVELREYDPVMGMLAAVEVKGLYRLEYGRDKTSKVETQNDVLADRVETFGYDDSHRLTAWTLEYRGETRATTYEYSAIGNLEKVRINGALVESHTYAGANGGAHALTGGTLGAHQYDDRGRLETSPGRSVDWTSFDLPASIGTPAGLTTFVYDAEGRRVRKSGVGEDTVFVGGEYERRSTLGGMVHVFHVRAAETVVAEVLFDAGTKVQSTLYVVGDHLTTPGLVTDQAGVVVDQPYYDPFGRRVDVYGSAISVAMGEVRIGFAGENEDRDLGLVDMGGRVYSPSMRRFLSADPIVAMPENGQALNRYSYVMNDPLNLVDPSGYLTSVTGDCALGSGGCNGTAGGGLFDGLMSLFSDMMSSMMSGFEEMSFADQGSFVFDQAAVNGFSAQVESGLTVGSADDVMERESDAVAEQVMSSRGTQGGSSIVTRVDSGSGGGAGAALRAGVSDAEGQRTADKSGGGAVGSKQVSGADFSKVRTESGVGGFKLGAGMSDPVITSRAYTLGSDVAFGAGRFSPDASSGQRLLAHELAHVAQHGAPAK